MLAVALKEPSLLANLLLRVTFAVAWANRLETRDGLWAHEDWVLRDKHLKKSLGYCGLGSVSEEERAVRIHRNMKLSDEGFFRVRCQVC